jgi:flavin reductase (DIM6/NTAB) family NADH-FMN oxidoreductase RutF
MNFIGAMRKPNVLEGDSKVAVEKAEFRRALGHFAAGVTVVTTKLSDGQAVGITVTAFSSLSLDPPLALICIDKRARIHDRLQVGSAFAVNLLAQDQEFVSRRFASSEPDQFREIGYRDGTTGAPLIAGAIATVECRITDLLPGGDHTIVIGTVEATSVAEGKPLLYFRGGYGQLA